MSSHLHLATATDSCSCVLPPAALSRCLVPSFPPLPTFYSAKTVPIITHPPLLQRPNPSASAHDPSPAQLPRPSHPFILICKSRHSFLPHPLPPLFFLVHLPPLHGTAAKTATPAAPTLQLRPPSAFDASQTPDSRLRRQSREKQSLSQIESNRIANCPTRPLRQTSPATSSAATLNLASRISPLLPTGHWHWHRCTAHSTAIRLDSTPDTCRSSSSPRSASNSIHHPPFTIHDPSAPEYDSLSLQSSLNHLQSPSRLTDRHYYPVSAKSQLTAPCNRY